MSAGTAAVCDVSTPQTIHPYLGTTPISSIVFNPETWSVNPEIRIFLRLFSAGIRHLYVSATRR